MFGIILRLTFSTFLCHIMLCTTVESSWNVMAHGDAREGKWRGNWRMEWVASTLHTTSEHGISSITTADSYTSAASSRMNWRPRWFKWTRPFRRKTKSGFYACAITFQTQSTILLKKFPPPFCNKASSVISVKQWNFPADNVQQESTAIPGLTPPGQPFRRLHITQR